MLSVLKSSEKRPSGAGEGRTTGMRGQDWKRSPKVEVEFSKVKVEEDEEKRYMEEHLERKGITGNFPDTLCLP